MWDAASMQWGMTSGRVLGIEKAVNYYGYMFGSGKGIAVAFDGDGKEESFAEHDRHYHPDGYKEGDKCNKRERLEREDGVLSQNPIESKQKCHHFS